MLFPTPSPLKPESRPCDLKDRLDWGEPALTIIDVRDRNAFETTHITGAISIPISELVARVSNSLEVIRDIYVYGGSDEETATAATLLKDAGYENVAVLVGGLAAWKTVGYPTEGNFAVAV